MGRRFYISRTFPNFSSILLLFFYDRILTYNKKLPLNGNRIVLKYREKGKLPLTFRTKMRPPPGVFGLFYKIFTLPAFFTFAPIHIKKIIMRPAPTRAIAKIFKSGAAIFNGHGDYFLNTRK